MPKAPEWETDEIAVLKMALDVIRGHLPGDKKPVDAFERDLVAAEALLVNLLEE